MINLHEKELDEKLDNMLEELFTKATEKISKPKVIITYNLHQTIYSNSTLDKVDDAQQIIQRICELHEGNSEIHINVDI